MTSDNFGRGGHWPPEKTLYEPAYGKLNLTLDVLGRREDGYHDLRMVMCSVELHDDIEIRLGGAEGCACVFDVGAAIGRQRASAARPYSTVGNPACHSEACSDEASGLRFFAGAQNDMNGTASVGAISESPAALPQDENNLAYKAARAYCSAAGIDPGGCFITIRKRIPMQAGMAGGSSDAAAVLRGLNRHFGAFSDEELLKLGLTLGSDVPYCLFGGVALAEGRGERLTRLPELPSGLFVVLAKPDFSVSTPALFRALDEAKGIRDPGSGVRVVGDGAFDVPSGCTAGDDLPDEGGSRPADRADSAAQYIGPYGRESNTDAMLAALAAGDLHAIGGALSNDFAPVLAEMHPIIEAVKQTMKNCGALGAELTGTGSVIFGLFDDPTLAQAACTALSRQVPFVQVTTLRSKL